MVRFALTTVRASPAMVSARPPAAIFFIRTAKIGPVAPPVPRFPRIWPFIYPASPGHPRSLGAHSETPDERKAGTGPLCRRENTQTLQYGRKSPSPSPR
jgi:hypothetical protein